MKSFKNMLSESILDDIDVQLKAGDELIEFVNWLISGYCKWNANKKKSVENANNSAGDLLNYIKRTSTGVYEIDVEGLWNNSNVYFKCDHLFIYDIPKTVKKIVFKNAKWSITIHSLINDLSKLDIDVYRDNGVDYGHIVYNFSSTLSNTDIKLGNIVCNSFEVNGGGDRLKSILIGKKSIMLDVDLTVCTKLKNIYGNFIHATRVGLPNGIIQSILADHGLISTGCKLALYD